MRVLLGSTHVLTLGYLLSPHLHALTTNPVPVLWVIRTSAMFSTKEMGYATK